jgi:segregation and condensation protein B
VTRAEIEEIRGCVGQSGTVDQLIELGWVRFGRRRMTVGRPVTFVVTQGFLDHFGLENARDLPGLKELREAGLLDSRARRCRGGGVAADDTGQLFEDPEEPRDEDTLTPRRPIFATFQRILRADREKKGRAGPMDRIAT